MSGRTRQRTLNNRPLHLPRPIYRKTEVTPRTDGLPLLLQGENDRVPKMIRKERRFHLRTTIKKLMQVLRLHHCTMGSLDDP